MKELAELRERTGALDAVAPRSRDAREMLGVFEDEAAGEEEADRSIARRPTALDALEMAASFSGEFDAHNAIVSVFAGADGVDAADWAADAYAHVLALAESKGFATQIVDESPAEEAGLKSVTFFVRGRNAYRLLESERGVHRLVRLSPFDAAHRRHTSFAAVDVIPEVRAGEEPDVEIKPDDLRVETFKSGGAGGQYVNKTESAVRVMHVPTGIIVASQQERSQAQNRDVALSILRAKLVGTRRPKSARASSTICAASARRTSGDRRSVVRAAAVSDGEGSSHGRRDRKRRRRARRRTSTRSSGPTCSSAARAASLNDVRDRFLWLGARCTRCSSRGSARSSMPPIATSSISASSRRRRRARSAVFAIRSRQPLGLSFLARFSIAAGRGRRSCDRR